MSELVERWRAQMSRPHVIIHELRDIGTALANENEKLRAALAGVVSHMDGNGMGDWPAAKKARAALGHQQEAVER